MTFASRKFGGAAHDFGYHPVDLGHTVKVAAVVGGEVFVIVMFGLVVVLGVFLEERKGVGNA